ncbi:hypothetical protein [Pseudomonas sp.]|uniref:hypothetical protein n=1 Tax=Pseudomonas sp. TaxID=306 RepID=UPI0035624A78
MTDSTAAEAPTFTQTRILIERAKLQTRIWLDSGGLEHTAAPDSLRAHAHADMLPRAIP